MKLKEYAKKHGLHYNTVYGWFHQGKLKNAVQLDTGTILVYEDEENNKTKEEKIVTYARVSSRERKNSLIEQENRLINFCNARGWIVNKSYKEIASGMNDNRKLLLEMLNNNPTKIVIENKDRLTRFGFNYLKVLLEKLGCEIVVLNDSEDQEDLKKDLVSLITSFCGRIYGLRRAKNKLNKIKELVKNDNV